MYRSLLTSSFFSLLLRRCNSKHYSILVFFFLFVISLILNSGEMLGPDQPVILHMLEIPQAKQALDGIVMELEDCAYPLLHGPILIFSSLFSETGTDEEAETGRGRGRGRARSRDRDRAEAETGE